MKKKTDYIWVVVILLSIATLTYRSWLIESITNYCKEHCMNNEGRITCGNCYEGCIEALELGMSTILK